MLNESDIAAMGDAAAVGDVVETVEAPVATDPFEWVSLAPEEDNLAPFLEEEQLAKIGDDIVSDYDLDYRSMATWRDEMQRGLDLATLVKGEKVYPFKNASNVKYPLITTAALQFNARAYPAIVPADAIVRVKTHGSDPQGEKAARGERIGAHMSYQLGTEMEEWEDDTDKLLVQLPIVGTMVRKVWFDAVAGRPRSRVIKPGDFVVNDTVRCIDDAPRVSERLPLYPAEIETRKREGIFRDIDYRDGDKEDRQAQEDFIEQHCRLDLDEDGYEEPYIVTVHKDSRKVARIVADFEARDVIVDDEQIVAIRRGSYFVPYHFLPSLDGGFFGTGLGRLLGDTSETINTIINMLVDAGHMASLGGGFIGKEFRIKGASQRFSPGEWKTSSAPGADIRSSVVPMTFPGPDQTLFAMLGMLIEAGKEVASVKDIMTGDTGSKNMTATTTLALIEQGMMVFTAAYKRIFRALKREYRLIAKINATTVSPEVYNAFHDGDQMFDPSQDYGAHDMDVVPVADPRSVTKMQEAAKAQIVLQMAETGMVDKGEAAKRVLESASIAEVEELMPKPDPMQQQLAQMSMQAAQADLAMKSVGIEKALAEIGEIRTKAMKNLADAEATEAGSRLDAVKLQLEAMRDDLTRAIGQRPGAMALLGGGGGGQVMPYGGPGGGGAVPGGGVPFGPPAPAGGAFGPAEMQGDFGGLV